MAFDLLFAAMTKRRSQAVAVSVPANSFRAFYEDTTNKIAGSSYTFTAADLGTAHAKRVIIVGVHQTQTVSALTINGVAATQIVAQGITIALWAAVVPSGVTGDIVVPISGSTSARCAIAVWAVYPLSSTPLDFVTGTAGALTNAAANDLEIVSGGFVTYFAVAVVASTITTTWSGSDAVVADVPSRDLEAAQAWGAGHIVCTQSSTTLDLTLAATVSGTKTIVAVSYGAQ